MTSFLLGGLEPALLEKIITKLDDTSYFRMRQTCRGMDEFIRKNKNISVHLEDSFHYLKYDETQQLRIFSLRKLGGLEEDVEKFYGTRLFYLQLPDKGFDELCKFLKTHRITCEHLCMFNSTYSKEECTTLLKILNPTSALMSSIDSNRYEALLQSKILKQADLQIDDKFEVKTVIPKFLSQFSDFSMSIHSKTARYDMIMEILQILCPIPPLNLHNFHFLVYGNTDLNKIEPKLREIGMTIDTSCRIPRIWMDMPNGFVCRVCVASYGIHVNYHTSGYQSERDSLDDYDEDSDSDDFIYGHYHCDDSSHNHDLPVYYPPVDSDSD